jgi:hypothetical protein
MITIQRTVDVSDSHKLTIDIPPEIPAGKICLTYSAVPASPAETERTALKAIPADQIKTLLRDDDTVPRRYSNRAQDLREARLSIAFQYGRPHENQSYAKYAGCLKDSGVFTGDSIAIQEEMRREWV